MSVIDLTGQQFGLLTVIQRDFNPHKGKEAWWLCQCECGKQKAIRGSDLRRGKTKSCGCLSIKQAKINIISAHKKNNNKNNNNNNNKNNQQSLIGKIFGKLKVIEELSEKDKYGYRQWKCLCECGNITISNTNALNNGKKLSCGCLKSKGEMVIQKLLQENNIAFEKEKIFTSCKFTDTKNYARFDFFINQEYIIEFDGIQHFTYTNQDWNTQEHYQKLQEHDNFKNQWCQENNIPLIRIPYWKLNSLTINDLLLQSSKFVIRYN